MVSIQAFVKYFNLSKEIDDNILQLNYIYLLAFYTIYKSVGFTFSMKV